MKGDNAQPSERNVRTVKNGITLPQFVDHNQVHHPRREKRAASIIK